MSKWVGGPDADAGDRRRLIITPAGLEAIGVESAQAGAGTPDAVPEQRAHPETQRARPGGKLGVLLDAVSRPEGATLEDLTAASGWLPHTTRAAITRLRQRGFDVRIGDDGDAQGLSPGPGGLIDAELERDRRRGCRAAACRAAGGADRRPGRPVDRRPAAGLVRGLGRAAAEGGAAAAADARHRLEVAGRAARRLLEIGRAAARDARGGLPAERCAEAERAPTVARAARRPAAG